MKALVLALCSLCVTTSLAHADGRAPQQVHARTASYWIYNLMHTPAAALRKTSPVIRHRVSIASPCLVKWKQSGAVVGDKRGAYLACLGETLATRKPDPSWAVVPQSKLPMPVHRTWARTFAKGSVFVLGNHGDGYIVVALAARPAPHLMGRLITGVLVDDTLGGRETNSR